MAVRTEVILYHNFKGLSSLFEKNVCTELSKRPNDPRKNRQQYTKSPLPTAPLPSLPEREGNQKQLPCVLAPEGWGLQTSTVPSPRKGRESRQLAVRPRPKKGGASNPPTPLLPEREGNQGSLPCVLAPEGQGSKTDRQEGNLHNPLP